MSAVTLCKTCGRPFEPLSFEYEGRCIFLQLHCNRCYEENERVLETKKERPLSTFDRLCPPDFRVLDWSKLRRQPWMDRVLSWKYGPKGIVVAGKTGTGKTRIIWQLFRRLFDEGIEIEVTDSSTFRAQNAEAAREGETQGWIRRLSRVDLFYFDDLGQMKVTEAAAETLVSIISKRGDQQKPCIFTTQYDGRELARQFERVHQAEAIRRRMSEKCELIEAVAFAGTPKLRVV